MGKLFLTIIAAIVIIAFVGTVCSNKEKEDEAQRRLKEEQDHKRIAGTMED